MEFSDSTAIDEAFERFLREQECREYSVVTGKIGRALSQASRSGHTLLSVEEIAVITGIDNSELIRKAISSSSLISQENNLAPIIYDNNGNLSLYKYWKAEKDLADIIIKRAGFSPVPENSGLLHDFFSKNSASTDEINWQSVATFAAVSNNLTIITGGPGTGKTTTVSSIVSLLKELDANIKLGLVAPTGKAATRLEESLAAQGHALNARTIHSFLGWRGNSFRYNKNNKAICNCLIIDEASMIDILLMCALFEALPDTCRVIMLGDENQLSSVEAGCVLSDLTAETEGFSSNFITNYAKTGEKAPVKACTNPLADNVIRLRKNWRFASQPGISKLAASIQSGDFNADIFEEFSDISLQEDYQTSVNEWLESLINELENSQTPQAALETIKNYKILCALRQHAKGISAINQKAEEIISRQRKCLLNDYYHLMPVIIEQNDYTNNLYNGDTGVCFDNGAGELLVYFENGVIISPTRLPKHSTAWAITVHKSQGSEFNNVLLITPPVDNPLCCRELLYTGITRSRKSVKIIATTGEVEAAIKNQLRRMSGLRKNIEALMQ